MRALCASGAYYNLVGRQVRRARLPVNKRPAPSSARGVLCSVGANCCGVVSRLPGQPRRA